MFVNAKGCRRSGYSTEVMDKDEMFMLDPMGIDFNFRVDNPQPSDINGNRIHDLHIMDHDLIESRLQFFFSPSPTGDY
jgi:hypothetical protein